MPAGLAYLHSQNPPIIHQDIKPDNILILKSGDYVITDFGISKQLRQSLRKSAMNLNSAGAISYMGPERFSKNFQAVKASDIWSLGAAIFELVTGDVPFCGMGGSLQRQGADMPELPEPYSERLNLICTSCLAKETWDRPTAAQVRDYASQVLDGQTALVTWKHEEPRSAEAPAPEPVSEPVPEPHPEAAPVSEAPAPIAATVMAAPDETAAAPAPAGGTEIIDAPEKSGFLKSQPMAQNKPSILVVLLLAAVGIIAGVVAGVFAF